jgi:hypothetical protein
MGRGNVVGVATCYALDGPGVEFRWSENFPTLPDQPWGQPSLLYDRHRIPYPGEKRPARGVDYLPNIMTRYSPSGTSWLILG